MAKNVSNMTVTEIAIMLNSGQYISAATKKQLQEKLQYERNMNRYNALDEFFAIAGSKNEPSTKSKSKKNKNHNDEFPTLDNKSDNHNSHNNAIDQKNINFGSIVGKKNPEELIIDDKINPLFVNNQLVLSWADIDEIYEYYAIYRIRMQHIILNKKIYMIDSIDAMNPGKADIFKKYFNYDRMVGQENQLSNCLNILLEIRSLTNCFKLIIDLLTKYRNRLALNELIDPAPLKKMLDAINSSYQEIKLIANLFVGPFSKYLDEINKYLDFIENLLENISNITGSIGTDKNVSLTILSQASVMYLKIDKLIDQIIDDNDPHIECEYYVSLKSSASNPIFPYGLSTSIYLSCDEEIGLSDLCAKQQIEQDFGLFTNKNKSVDKSHIENLTQDEFSNYFAKMKADNNKSHFIKIILKHPNYRCISLNYDLEEIIPVPKASIKITGLPENTLLSTSILRNRNLDEKMKIFNTPNINLTNILNRRTHNDLYKLSEPELNLFGSDWKDYYSTKNIFVVDYLFNEMLNHDRNNILINTSMIYSFRDLANKTSE